MNIKNELKDWEKEFENRTGRQPNMEDKAVMNERYIAYKMVSVLVVIEERNKICNQWDFSV